MVSFIPLLFGGIIYLCFRDENLLLFHWLRKLHIDYSLLRLVNIKYSIIKSYIMYSLPNGLWIFSGILILGLIWKDKIYKYFSYVSILISLALFMEVAQKFGIMYGTFDVVDLLTIIVFSGMGIFIKIFWRKNEKN